MIKLGYLLQEPMQNFFDLTNRRIIFSSCLRSSFYTGETHYIRCCEWGFGFFCKKRLAQEAFMSLPQDTDPEKLVNIVRYMGFDVKCSRHFFFEKDVKCTRQKKCRKLTGVVEGDLIKFLEEGGNLLAGNSGLEIEESDPSNELF